MRVEILSTDSRAGALLGMAKTKHNNLASMRQATKSISLYKKIFVGTFLIELFTSPWDDWIRISGGKEYLWLTPMAMWYETDKITITKATNGVWETVVQFTPPLITPIADPNGYTCTTFDCEDGVIYWGTGYSDVNGVYTNSVRSYGLDSVTCLYVHKVLFTFESRVTGANSATLRAIAIWRGIIYIAMETQDVNVSSYVLAYTQSGELLWSFNTDIASLAVTALDVSDDGIVVSCATAYTQDIYLLTLNGQLIVPKVDITPTFSNNIILGVSATNDGSFEIAGVTGFIASPFNLFTALLRFDRKGTSKPTINDYGGGRDPLDFEYSTDHRKEHGAIFPYRGDGGGTTGRANLFVFDRAPDGILTYRETIPTLGVNMWAVRLGHTFKNFKQSYVGA
jgi:hypothetical protein